MKAILIISALFFASCTSTKQLQTYTVEDTRTGDRFTVEMPANLKDSTVFWDSEKEELAGYRFKSPVWRYREVQIIK